MNVPWSLPSEIALAGLLVAADAGEGSGRARVVAFEGAPAANVAQVELAVDRGIAAAAAWIGRPPPDDPALEVRWFPNHESMGRALGAAGYVLDDPRRGAVALAFGSRPDGAGADAPAATERLARRAGACAALRSLAPDADARVRAALAELVADPGCAPECTRVAAALRRAGALPEWPALLDPAQRLSPEIVRAAAISLLATTGGADAATGRAATLAPDAAQRAAWLRRLDAEPAEAPAPWAIDTSGLRGFCFAHEGYRWVDGYGSHAAARSLARVKELGANAVSLTPFAFQRDVAQPRIGTIFEERAGSSRGGMGSETDASIAVTAADARALGLTVVLKPHLWCGHGRWCGEIAMTSDADWSAWFADYERLALHYALLARRLQIPVFALGTELKGTTAHEAQWRALIAKVRALYPGRLTYCANWGDEVERIGFWDAFDAVGVSAYWPLADAPGSDRAQLARRFTDVLATMRAIGERTGRPVWFLEIGFADVEQPWLKPNEAKGNRDGGQDQAIAYRIVLGATRALHFPDALFWWKWPSDLERGGPDERWHDFWPNGRPAEQEVERAWGASGGGGR